MHSLEGEDTDLTRYKLAMAAITAAAIALAAIPVAVALDDESSNHDEYDGLVTVRGEVTAFVCCEDYDSDEYQGHDDYDDEDDEQDEEPEDDKCMLRAGAFVIDNETVVKFGPWWYWMVQELKVTDVVHVGDVVEVVGELYEDDNYTVVEAWQVQDVYTGEEITIKEEGRPPWAGGPKELGIMPWPPSFEDE